MRDLVIQAIKDKCENHYVSSREFYDVEIGKINLNSHDDETLIEILNLATLLYYRQR